jgi:inosine-uridine nucleoside N-ribohydrolase
MAQRVILDVDTGTDDAVALMLAALHPDLELIGATTVAGNVPVAVGTENSLRVLDHIGAPAPVYEGVAQPLVRPDDPTRPGLAPTGPGLAPTGPGPAPTRPSRVPTRRGPVRSSAAVHGRFLDLPEARSRRQATGAVEFLVETYRATSVPIILVALGPLSNVATAFTVEPRLADLVPELVIMGGVLDPGRVEPGAEFNLRADPTAAHIVLTGGVRRITLVTHDATHRAPVSDADCARLRALATPAADAAARFIERRIEGYRATSVGRVPVADETAAAPVHDALAVAAIVDPGVIATRLGRIDVDARGRLRVGSTAVDAHRRGGRGSAVRVAHDALRERFVAILLDTLARGPARRG